MGKGSNKRSSSDDDDTNADHDRSTNPSINAATASLEGDDKDNSGTSSPIFNKASTIDIVKSRVRTPVQHLKPGEGGGLAKTTSTSTSTKKRSSEVLGAADSSSSSTSSSASGVSPKSRKRLKKMDPTTLSSSSSGGGGGKKQKKSQSEHENSNQMKFMPPYYKWADGAGKQHKNGKIFHNSLETDVGGKVDILHVGDSVLLSSGDLSLEDYWTKHVWKLRQKKRSSKQKKKKEEKEESGKKEDTKKEGKEKTKKKKRRKSSSLDPALYGSANDATQDKESHYLTTEEDDNTYHEEASEENDDFTMDLMDALDPFVARIEKMWEEPPPDHEDDVGGEGTVDTTKARSEEEHIHMLRLHDEKRTRMKIRARWYFKKEDIEALGGHFIGPSRTTILSHTTSRDLILSNQTDDNEVSTIWGKCRVVRRIPPPNATGKEVPKGSFVCKYDIDIIPPPPRSGKAGYVVSNAFDGEENDGPVHSSNKEARKLGSREERKANVSSSLSLSSSTEKKGELISGGTEQQQDTTNVEKDAAGSKDTASSSTGQRDKIKEKDVENDPNDEKERESKQNSRNDNKDDKTKQDQRDEKGFVEQNTSADTTLKSNVTTTTKEATIPPDNYDATDQNNNYQELMDIEENNCNSNEDIDDGNDSTSSDFLTSRRKPPITTEGSTFGKIHVGSNHQAEVPSAPLPSSSTYKNKLRDPPDLVWIPNAIENEKVDEYLGSAGKTLKTYMDNYGIDTVSAYASSVLASSRSKNNEDEIGGMDEVVDSKEINQQQQEHQQEKENEEPNSSLPSDLSKDHKPCLVNRECNIDLLLSLLHTSSYNTSTALSQISNHPQSYLTIWTKREKELFNAGFRRYCGSLHMIGKCLGTTKSFKDIVDYHYRFKIPDQFRRYQEKKRVQARKMLEYVERRRLEGVFGVGVGDSKNVSIGLVGELLKKCMDSGDVVEVGKQNKFGGSSGAIMGNSKKIRNWSKTGGATDNKTIGAMEERRVTAKTFLLQVRETIGENNYQQIADTLKKYNAQSCSLEDLKESVVDALKTYPILLERFLEFMPKKYRA